MTPHPPRPSAPPPFRPPLSDEQLDRVWERLADAPTSDSSLRSPWPTRLALGSALAAALVLGVLLVPRMLAPPALELAEGAALPPGARVSTVTTLSDGSQLAPEQLARVEVLRNAGGRFVARQSDGRCRYSVTPGGRRTWVIETPQATVEVLGTVFSVDARTTSVAISVERGRVRVRSRGASSQERLLEAGESWRIAETDEVPPAPGVPPAPLAAPPELSAAQVLARAEATLVTGGTDEAAQQLERWLERAPRDSDWSVVALRLGILELETRKAPAQALPWLERVSLGELEAPPSVLEDASALRVLALERMGRTPEARRAATAFEARWPRSAWLTSLRDRGETER